MDVFRVGIDIGGTFTDLVAVNQNSGEMVTAKQFTTPSDPTNGFVNVLKKLLETVKDDHIQILMVVHGTTIATNAVLEGKLPRTALINTKGFRDVLEIGRRLRKELYNLFIDKPNTIVERRFRLEVNERTCYDGSILQEIDKTESEEIIQKLGDANVAAVAICFLNSYANPKNEKVMKNILQNRLPGIYLTASYEICREFREYERVSTTVMNAALMPVVYKYIDRLDQVMKQFEDSPKLFIMQSNGGVTTVAGAKESPVKLMLSGPAGGVMACQYIGKLIQCPNIIGFDMGGTSTDVSVIVDGNPNVSMEGEVAGYPIKTPLIDIKTIGAGGGSIAWIDSGGALRVGPQSAGADPGPICYDKSGTQPTVTDANLVLGYIDPNYFLGGEIKLNYQLAEKYMGEMAKSIGLETVTLAEGIIRIANANMERAIKVSSVEKGLDPRDFALLAFGGAGGLHANTLAETLDIPKVIVPEVSSELSALGLLVTDIKHDYAITKIIPSDKIDLNEIKNIYQDLENMARQQLVDEGVSVDDIIINRTMDMRYVGQAYEINVPLRKGHLGEEGIQQLIHDFHLAHKRLYAYSASDRVVEMVNFRVNGIGLMNPLDLKKDELVTDVIPSAAIKTERPVYLNELSGFRKYPVYERRELVSGNIVKGPAIVEQVDSTTLILPHYQAWVDPDRNLVITKVE